MRNQSGQGFYRGGENKKVKSTKAEKVFLFVQRNQLKANALKLKKIATT